MGTPADRPPRQARPGALPRREFFRTAGALAAGFCAANARVVAGPFAPGEIGQGAIPEDKRLDPSWVRSLSDRGEPTVYTKRRGELRFIGMPVGGIQTGTLYLGGDGRLWLWDIFNDNREGVDPKTVPWGNDLHVGKVVRSRDGSAYVAPAAGIRPVDQGFAFRITWGGTTVIRRMNESDWEDVRFEATYPIATITYVDRTLPVEISAEVFSPFIPLDEKHSGLPATIYTFTILNRTSAPVDVTVAGWLENKTCLRSAGDDHERANTAHGDARDILLASIRSRSGDEALVHLPDYGTLALAAVGLPSTVSPRVDPADAQDLFRPTGQQANVAAASERLTGAVLARVGVAGGAAATADFVVAWHFPNLALKQIPDRGRFYATWLGSAGEVVDYVRARFASLAGTSRLWKRTFYDSTLPHWFLERTFLNISCLATTTSHRMATGRYYAWEGVGCCPGTCTHVWQYAQAPGRVFPAMERDTRERVDLGIALQPDGSMWYRAEADRRPAVDGQAGTILRFYREHRMSPDRRFLADNWTKIRRTITFLMSLDRNGDGMEDTPVENTLDAMWDGEIAWIVGLCLAAVKAGAMMAAEVGDAEFANACRAYVDRGARAMETLLFNGEYFVHRPDRDKGRARLGSYNTCHIDQVYGQSWAFQAGLGRVLDAEKTRSALRSLWKYNFTPDVGPYVRDHAGGRPYALAGEGGLIMNTNPRGEAKPYGDNVTWQLGYFHECMTGFEHQVASHMMAEGMVDEALVLTRTIHDRYHASKRNPFNEIECSDHYARAMASYGTFITACGFEYHGPDGALRFAPRIRPDDFRAPFVTAEGWGTYRQRRTGSSWSARIDVRHGRLGLRKFAVVIPFTPSRLRVSVGGREVTATWATVAGECTCLIQPAADLTPASPLDVVAEA